MDSLQYCDIQENAVTKPPAVHCEKQSILIQDNAPLLTFGYTKHVSKTNSTQTLGLSAKSFDLNDIKNNREWLASEV